MATDSSEGSRLARWCVSTSLALLALPHIGVAKAVERPSILPPEMRDSSLDSLYDVEEEPIWQQVPRGSLVRYRVSFVGINCKRHTVLFDERMNGSVWGEVKVWNQCHSDEPYQAHRFRLRAVDFSPIKAAMDKAGLWQRAASYWTVQDENTICIDGIDVTFERRDGSDYRMDQSNVWCQTTRDFVVAARMLLIAAGDQPGLALLPRIDNDR